MWSFVTQYWLEWIFGVAAAALGVGLRKLTKKFKAQQAEAKNIKKGLLAMLHDRLYQACRYYLNRGTVDVDGLDNLRGLYEVYHDLGGNGTGTELYKRVKTLPFEDD